MGLSNTYFRFKQFNIEQAGCAMKVTTDACIQGAWTPVAENVKRILDIGTGTGLLALMLAQRSKEATIDAIELDTAAALQAQQNVRDAPWADRINIIETDANGYQSPNKYDLIVTNPPFFNNSLQGNNATRNNARHTNTLSYNQLLHIIDTNLDKNGKASVLLPCPETDLWIALLHEHNWHVLQCLQIKHTDSAAIKRMVLMIGRNPADVTTTETLVIKGADGAYTQHFSQLLSPYYLAL